LFCQFLNTVYEKSSEYMDKFTLIDNIKWNICNDYYVNICYDEFYIQERWATLYKHYGHYNLFYGID